MNEIIQSLFNRKSVRVYAQKEISEKDKRIIFESALQAPTAGNMCLYSILNITDQEIKEKLSRSCDNQPFIAAAPMVLIFCADYHRWYDVFCKTVSPVRKPEEGDLFLAMSDTFIAAQNAVAAGESLGIGSCYIGDIMENYEYHRDLLKLPDYVLPVCMLCFGYPTEQQKQRTKPPRFRIEDVVKENFYLDTDMEQMLRDRQNFENDEECEEWIRRFCKRKWNCDFGNEMNRSVRAMLDRWKHPAE